MSPPFARAAPGRPLAATPLGPQSRATPDAPRRAWRKETARHRGDLQGPSRPHARAVHASAEAWGLPGRKGGARLLPREAVTGCGLVIFFVASTPKSSRAPEGRTDAQVGFAASAADCARAPASQNGCRKLRRPRGENQVVTRSRGHRRPSWLPVYPEAPAKGAARLHLGQVEGRRRKPWRPSARLALRSRND